MAKLRDKNNKEPGRTIAGNPLRMGAEIEILCMGELGRKRVKVTRHGVEAPSVVYVRAARVVMRSQKGALVLAQDADGVHYTIRVLSSVKTLERVKVTSGSWSVCHILWEPEAGRAIIEATVQRLALWNALMDKADAHAARLGLVRAAARDHLVAQQAEIEALRSANGTSDLLKVFADTVAGVEKTPDGDAL